MKNVPINSSVIPDIAIDPFSIVAKAKNSEFEGLTGKNVIG